MSATKAKGSSKNGRDSQSKRLGVKVYGGEIINKGSIILRQRGSKFHAGDNTKMGGDDTIFAIKDGTVTFQKKTVKSFSGHRDSKTVVSVR